MLLLFPAAKAKGSHLRVHFKNTREAANAIKHMHLRRAVKFLKNVINKKEIVPFTRFRGDVGRKAQVSYKCPSHIPLTEYEFCAGPESRQKLQRCDALHWLYLSGLNGHNCLKSIQVFFHHLHANPSHPWAGNGKGVCCQVGCQSPKTTYQTGKNTYALSSYNMQVIWRIWRQNNDVNHLVPYLKNCND